MRNQMMRRPMHGMQKAGMRGVQAPGMNGMDIINDLRQKIQPHLPQAIEKFPALERYTIFQGKDLIGNAPAELAGGLDPESFYLVFKMSGQGSRQQAADLFKFIMEEKLGMPRSGNSVLDEILPRQEYRDPVPPARQLAAPAGDVIDLDPETGDIPDAAKNAMQVDVRPRFYGVEIKVMPAPMGAEGGMLPPPRGMRNPRLGGFQQGRLMENQQENYEGDSTVEFAKKDLLSKLMGLCDKGDPMWNALKDIDEKFLKEDDMLDGRNHNLHVEGEDDMSAEDKKTAKEVGADVSECGLKQYAVDEDDLDKSEMELFESISKKLRSQLV